MRVFTKLNGEGGYTLLESLVAMALFVSVLLPLLGLAGAYASADGENELREALRLAQSEINLVSFERDFNARTFRTDRGFLVTRSFEHSFGFTRISVSVTTTKHPEREILVLQKTFLTER